MGVLVSGILAGGSPLSARLMVGMLRLKHGPMGTGRRDSIRKAGEACFLSNIVLRVNLRPDDPSSGIAGASGTRRCIGLSHWSVTGGDRLKGAKLASTGASNARNDPAQALPQRLLDTVGVWNSVDGDNGLGHGHPADLGVVVTQAGEDGGQYLPGLVWSHEPAQQRGKGGVHLGESSLSPDPNTLEAGRYEGPEYLG